MNIDQVLQVLLVSQKKPLTPLQELVLRSCWEGKTYRYMADEAHYGAQSIREIASQLWHVLSEIFGEPISKANFRHTLEVRPLTKAQQQLIEKHTSNTPPTLEFPSGPVMLSSRFYIPRSPIEELAYREIIEPGCVIRIKGSSQMGKSSLMLRIIDYAASVGYRSVNLDFQQADSAIFANLDKFLRWFCANISSKLELQSRLDDYWDEEIGSKVSCTNYFQRYLLENLTSPLVLALNEVNRVFEYPAIAQEFLPLLRSWHEQAKQTEIWQKLRLLVAYSTEIYVPLKLNQSPFNIGLPLKLPPLTMEQVQDLAQRHGLDWRNGKQAKQLMSMVGGHPYLVRLALYHVSQGNVTLKELLQEAATESGIYNDHLRRLLTALQEQPELGTAVTKLIAAQECVKLEYILAYKLESIGLVKLAGDRANFSCELYRLYCESANFGAE
ncbi:MAG: AAA-like domain-containing protein [Nostoc sp. EkiNYC01]|nr:AAA-like domain-containing protein [Nostoc sp. EkiNYC01]